MDNSSSYPHYTVRRSCFVKHFPKIDSTLPRNPLTSAAAARAATAGVEALPNTPFFSVSFLPPIPTELIKMPLAYGTQKSWFSSTPPRRDFEI
jgi:hypothetical protein